MTTGTQFQQRRAAHQKRKDFVLALRKHGRIRDALIEAEWTPAAYYKSRSRWPDFAADCDVALGRKGVVMGDNGLPTMLGPQTNYAGDGWDGTFRSFREVFLGRASPWFHLLAVNQIEQIIHTAYRNAGLTLSEPVPPTVELDFGGQVILILWPPEHGKTALWEDFDNYALARWPWFRIGVGSEKQSHGNKVLNFVRSRFEDDAPGPGLGLMRSRFGPFSPRKGRRVQQQWSATNFDVYKKPVASQRDNSMVSIGMGGSIIGTRLDLLQVDDPQSRKTLNQTETLVETFRQDWLSRPGPTGFTVVLMNRVGENDFPEAIVEAGLVDHVITVPVWDPERGWAWPERYSHHQYLGMRKRVGADAWDRNYMQIGLATRSQAFTDALITPCCNPLRSISHAPPKHPSGGEAQVCLTVDPGYGCTAIGAFAFEPTKLRTLDITAAYELSRPEQMYAMLEDKLLAYTMEGTAQVPWVVVETKAFQAGFITDDRFLELQSRFGFDAIPHLTGVEKTDEDIGIPQMAMALRRHELDFPTAFDFDREQMGQLFKELKRWRPHVSGAKLRQDRVIVLWFAWMLWRRLRRVHLADAAQFNFRGVSSR